LFAGVQVSRALAVVNEAMAMWSTFGSWTCLLHGDAELWLLAALTGRLNISVLAHEAVVYV